MIETVGRLQLKTQIYHPLTNHKRVYLSPQQKASVLQAILQASFYMWTRGMMPFRNLVRIGLNLKYFTHFKNHNHIKRINHILPLFSHLLSLYQRGRYSHRSSVCVDPGNGLPLPFPKGDEYQIIDETFVKLSFNLFP